MGIGKKIRGGVELLQATLLHDHHSIRAHNGAESMCYRQYRAVRQVLVDGILYDRFYSSQLITMICLRKKGLHTSVEVDVRHGFV